MVDGSTAEISKILYKQAENDTMSYTSEQIANALDYAVLSPQATVDDIRYGCAFANKHKLRSVCVASVNVNWASSIHPNVSAVIGFPHGNVNPFAKYEEAKLAITSGAIELDVVLNYGRYLGGDVNIIHQDLSICQYAQEHGVLVKAVLETCHYTTRQIYDACKRCVDEGVDFVKTSTGAFDGATVYAVTAMLDAVNGQCGVKASGGIKTYADVCTFLDLGCSRLGSSHFLELLPNE